MVRSILQVQANLLQYPEIDSQHLNLSPRAELNIGDLHGNALKLIYFLIRQNILSITEPEYEELRDIYLRSALLQADIYTYELCKRDIERFIEIISKAGVLNAPLIRFIGDELADRGHNDYFTLKIMEKLAKEKIPVEYVLSNHALEFIRLYEKDFNDFKTHKICRDQVRSVTNLGKWIELGLVDKNEVTNIVEDCYLPHLKAVSYSLDTKRSAITLYTHAPVGLPTLEALADMFDVLYQDDDVNAIANTINKINRKFLRKVAEKHLYAYAEINEVDCAKNATLEFPLVRIVWHRTDGLIEESSDDPFIKQQNGYHIYYVHGHSNHGYVLPGEDYVFNLDNELGKGESYQGLYIILYTKAAKSKSLKKAHRETQHLDINKHSIFATSKQAPEVVQTEEMIVSHEQVNAGLH